MSNEKTAGELSTGLVKVQSKLSVYQQPGAMVSKDAAFAVADLTLRATRAIQMAEAKMAEEAAPHAEKLAQVKARWDPLIKAFKEAKQQLNALTAEHARLDKAEKDRQAEAAAKALEEVRERQRAAEKAAREAPDEHTRARAQLAIVGATNESAKILQAQEDASRPLRGVSTEAGTVSVGEVWTWEVEDIAKVPAEYLEVKRGPVTAAVKAGARTIPGIRIFPKPSVQARPKR